MKTAIMIVTALALAVLAGCESSRGGGVSGGEGFTISTKTFTTGRIRQGETQSVTISLNRGQNFKRDVRLEMSASKGIRVEPTHAMVRGSDKPDVHLRITVPKDADLGEYKVYIRGTPDTGEATSTEITVNVVSP